jgi:hypothetical protein
MLALLTLLQEALRADADPFLLCCRMLLLLMLTLLTLLQDASPTDADPFYSVAGCFSC